MKCDRNSTYTVRSQSYMVEEDGSVLLNLQVKTQAPIQKLEVWKDSIDIHVQAPPSKGKANREIIELLSQVLKVPSVDISLVKGHRSSIKSVRIRHVERGWVEMALQQSDITGLHL